MHRKNRRLRPIALALGAAASIIAVAFLVTSLVVRAGVPAETAAAAIGEDVAVMSDVPAGPEADAGTPSATATAQPSLDDQLAAQAKKEADAAAAAAAQAEAEAEAEAAAKAEEEAAAAAAAQAAAEEQAQREAAAEAASRSAERAAEDPKSVAQALLSEYGWDDSEFSCLEQLWERESNWKHTAENPSSGAYGIPQALPASKMASEGDDYRTNPVTQIKWGLGYIEDRYGSPCSAWGHSESVGWY